MCITFCHRRRVLYWNHADCHPFECEIALELHGRCLDCRHQNDDRCGLTNAPLPDSGGCCHWNVAPTREPQIVTREMLAPLEFDIVESEVYLLKSLEAPYTWTSDGQLSIDPDMLGLPFTYGLGTERLPEEAFDWSEWLGQWCQTDVEGYE